MLRLRELRKSKKLTMREFGNLLGVAESTISLYENGKREPDSKTLMWIADYFEVSLDYLLGRTDIKEEPEELFTKLASKGSRTTAAFYYENEKGDRVFREISNDQAQLFDELISSINKKSKNE